MGSHAAEFVMPLVKKQIFKSDKMDHFYSTEQAPLKDRLAIFDKKWIYAKLFLSLENEEHFLRQYLSPFIQQMTEKGLIKKWFFVRYKEEKTHFRLRIDCPSASHQASLSASLSEWAPSLLLQGVLNDFSTHIYEREVERYGGCECIGFAEDLFCADSQCCIYLHHIFHNDPKNLPLFALSALAIVHYLIHFFANDLKTCIQFLNYWQNEHKLLSGSRNSLKIFSNLTHQLFFDQSDKIDKEENPLLFHLKSAFSHTGETIQIYNQKILDLEKKQELWNGRWNIYDSLIHMHCNRMLGIDLEIEKKARVTAYYILKKMGAL